MLRYTKVTYFFLNCDSVFTFWQKRALTSLVILSSDPSEILLTLCNGFGIFCSGILMASLKIKIDFSKRRAETTQDEMERWPSKKS
jgi:hypothetical protein